MTMSNRTVRIRVHVYTFEPTYIHVLTHTYIHTYIYIKSNCRFYCVTLLLASFSITVSTAGVVDSVALIPAPTLTLISDPVLSFTENRIVTPNVSEGPE